MVKRKRVVVFLSTEDRQDFVSQLHPLLIILPAPTNGLSGV